MRVPVVGVVIIRVEIDGFLELVLGGCPLPVVMSVGVTKRGVRLGQGIIYLDGQIRIRLRLGERLARAQYPGLPGTECCVTIGQSSIGLGVIGVLFDGVVEGTDRLFRHPLFASVTPKVTTFLEGAVSLGILRWF